MKIQKFLVQIESGADTRWLCGNGLPHLLKEEIAALIETYTEGTAPAVTVIREEVKP